MTTRREQAQARKMLVRISARLEHCETKKERAALRREFRAAAKVAGIDLPAERRKYRVEYKARCKAAALALPKEKRQEVLDAIRRGGNSVQGICDACGVSLDAFFGVFDLNSKVHTYRTLNEETV